MLKKNIAKLLVFAMILSMLPFSAVTAGAAGGSTEAVYSITLDASAKSLKVNEEYTLTADVSYKVNNDVYKVSDANVVIWSTSNENVATVNGGKVKGVGNGTATITASYTPTGKTTVTATCNITVTGGTTSKPTYTIEMDTTTKSLKVGEPYTLDADVMYKIGTDTHKVTSPKITWTSSKTDVASISGNTLTAQTAGETTITASYTPTGEATPVTKTRIVKVTADNDEGYTIKFDASPAKGSVNVRANDANVVSEQTKVKSGETVTIIAKATDTTYALNMDTFGAYRVNSDTAETWLSANAETGTYTFAMPASNVIITATFVNKTETPSERTVTVETKGDVVGTVVASGTYEVGSDVTLTVTERPAGYDVYVIAKDANGKEITVETKERNKSYTFKMPESNVTVTATFKQRDILSEGTITWVEWDNAAKGKVTLTGAIEGKYYVFEMMKKALRGGTVSGFACVQADDTGIIEVPCNKNVFLTVTEAEDETYNATTEGKKLANGETQTADGWAKPYSRDVSKAEFPNIMISDNKVPADSTQRNVTWVEWDNAAKGKVTVNGTIEGKYYVFEMMKKALRGGTVSAFACVLADETGKIEVPCNKNVFLTLTKAENETYDATTEGEKLVNGETQVTDGWTHPLS